MNKHLKKLSGRLRRTKDAAPATVPRITNDTLAEHREAVIAKGKRYKYPMQQTKHRTVAVSAIIVVLLVLGLGLLTWFRLYRSQDTSTFFYRVTQIIPLSVATVDGQAVPYQDYLLELRSAMHYLQTKEAVNFASDTGKSQLDYQKRVALNKVVEQTLIRKIAREQNITVSSSEVDAFIKRQIETNQLGASEDDFKSVIRDFYDWSFEEYQQSIEGQLLRRKVVFAIDTTAKNRMDTVYREATGGADFAELASERSDDAQSKANGGDIGFLGPNSDDPDRIYQTAKDLAVNQLTPVSQGIDNFYVAKVLEKRNQEVRVARITAQLTEFRSRMQQLRDKGQVSEHIDIGR